MHSLPASARPLFPTPAFVPPQLSHAPAQSGVWATARFRSAENPCAAMATCVLARQRRCWQHDDAAAWRQDDESEYDVAPHRNEETMSVDIPARAAQHTGELASANGTADPPRFYVNPAALTFAAQVRYRRVPRTISPLCRNGYHQPHFSGGPGPQCALVACRCYCHHPLEVAAFAVRQGRCTWCHGTGQRMSRPCAMCCGSGYGPGQPVTGTDQAEASAHTTPGSASASDALGQSRERPHRTRQKSA